MKRIFFVMVVVLSIVLMINSCNKNADVETKESIFLGSMESSEEESFESTYGSESAEREKVGHCVENYPHNAAAFGENIFFTSNDGIYRFDKKYRLDRIWECKKAVMKIYGDYLYFGIWKDPDLEIVRMDKEGNCSAVGLLESTKPISNLDFYEDVICIQYASGEVEGYYLADGEIYQDVEADKFLFYGEENVEGAPKHLVDAGYSTEFYGVEFLTKHISEGETGYDVFMLRDGDDDTELFQYYEQAFLYKNKVIYRSLPEMEGSQFKIYDLDTEESSDICTLEKGSFKIIRVENDKIYGYLEDIEKQKTYFAGINMNTGGIISYFEVSSDANCVEISDIAFYNSEGKMKYVELNALQ